MAAREIVDRRKPAFDALQLLRVEVQAPQVSCASRSVSAPSPSASMSLPCVAAAIRSAAFASRDCAAERSAHSLGVMLSVWFATSAETSPLLTIALFDPPVKLPLKSDPVLKARKSTAKKKKSG